MPRYGTASILAIIGGGLALIALLLPFLSIANISLLDLLLHSQDNTSQIGLLQVLYFLEPLAALLLLLMALATPFSPRAAFSITFLAAAGGILIFIMLFLTMGSSDGSSYAPLPTGALGMGFWAGFVGSLLGSTGSIMGLVKAW